MKPLETVRNISGDKLHANSIFLMMSQVIIAVFGYLFWIIIARTYNTHDIGTASALISVATLISNISILGLNNTLIRFLPSSRRRSEEINGAIIIVSTIALLCSALYLSAVTVLSPSLVFVRADFWLTILFAISMVLITINTLTDSVFIALRSTQYNLRVYLGYSVIRLVAPFIFIALGAVGIFLAHMSGILVAVILSIYYMMKKLRYNISAKPLTEDMNRNKGFSVVNYIAGFAWSMPLLLAPIIIINVLSANMAAYFYMVMMITNVLLIIPAAFTQSLFAECSNSDKNNTKQLIIHSARLFSIVIVLAIAGVVILGGFALSIFGQSYARYGLPLLYIMVISIPLVYLNMTANVIYKIKQHLTPILFVNIAGSLSTVIAMIALLKFGLIGIGLGYLAGHLLMLCINVFNLSYLTKRQLSIVS